MRLKGKVLVASLILTGLPSIAMMAFGNMEGPDVVELDTLVNIYEAVTFDHTMHTDIVSCAACHHHTTGMPAEDVRCLSCHAASGEADEIACAACHGSSPGNADKMKESQAVNLYHTDATGLKRAYHLQCLGCHREMGPASGCEDCHPRRVHSMKLSQNE